MRDVAEKSGISATEVSRLEAGKRQRPAPDILRSVAESLAIDYRTLLQLAGYLEPEKKTECAPQAYFTLEDGTAVPAEIAAQEMLKINPQWANIAYRVSKKLPKKDREMLTKLAEIFLKHRGIS